MKLKVKHKLVEIDDEDFPLVSKTSWSLSRKKRDSEKQYVRGWIRGTGRCQYLHRVILGVTNPQVHIDHINGNPLDNRKANLRICTNLQNQINKGPMKNCKSGYKGVTWIESKKLWRATIIVNKKQIYLGKFKKKEDAARAYNAGAFYYYGAFAWFNPVD